MEGCRVLVLSVCLIMTGLAFQLVKFREEYLCGRGGFEKRGFGTWGNQEVSGQLPRVVMRSPRHVSPFPTTFRLLDSVHTGDRKTLDL